MTFLAVVGGLTLYTIVSGGILAFIGLKFGDENPYQLTNEEKNYSIRMATR
jgi:hypothetical protein